MNSALLSSKKMDYCTPRGFFDTLNAEFHFTFYEAGVDFIGFEIDPTYYAAEEQRFLDYTSQTSLFHLT